MFSVWLAGITYGEGIFNVKISDIIVKNPPKPQCDCGEGADIDMLEKYGMAIHAAKQIKEKELILTKTKNLLCGRLVILPTINAQIIVDEGRNLEFLSNFSKSLRVGTAVAWVDIPDFFAGKGYIKSGPFGIIFVSEPIEVS